MKKRSFCFYMDLIRSIHALTGLGHAVNNFFSLQALSALCGINHGYYFKNISTLKPFHVACLLIFPSLMCCEIWIDMTWCHYDAAAAPSEQAFNYGAGHGEICIFISSKVRCFKISSYSLPLICYPL